MTIEEMRHLDAVKTYKELEEAKAEIKRLERIVKRYDQIRNRFLSWSVNRLVRRYCNRDVGVQSKSAATGSGENAD